MSAIRKSNWRTLHNAARWYRSVSRRAASRVISQALDFRKLVCGYSFQQQISFKVCWKFCRRPLHGSVVLAMHVIYDAILLGFEAAQFNFTLVTSRQATSFARWLRCKKRVIHFA